jgi:hypothetical protein
VTYGYDRRGRDVPGYVNVVARPRPMPLKSSLSPPGDEDGSFEPKNIRSPIGRNGTTSDHSLRLLEDLEDVRAYGYKAERAAELIYAHFKKEFGFPDDR